MYEHNVLIIYTVNHKKRDILFLLLLWLILTDLYSFNRDEILHVTVVKFTSP